MCVAGRMNTHSLRPSSQVLPSPQVVYIQSSDTLISSAANRVRHDSVWSSTKTNKKEKYSVYFKGFDPLVVLKHGLINRQDAQTDSLNPQTLRVIKSKLYLFKLSSNELLSHITKTTVM